MAKSNMTVEIKAKNFGLYVGKTMAALNFLCFKNKSRACAFGLKFIFIRVKIEHQVTWHSVSKLSQIKESSK